MSVTNFTADVLIGPVPLTVNFTDLSSPVPTAWLWDFGDGTSSSTLQNPTHTYTTGGVYSVTLTITSSAGYAPFTQTRYITVNPPSILGGPNAYRIAVQSGEVIYSSADPETSVNVNINGVATVRDNLYVGDNTQSGGTITTEVGQDLTLTTGTGGNIILRPNAGSLVINNVVWSNPIGNVVPGVFLGSSSLNNLQFYSFILPLPQSSPGYPNPYSDNLTTPDLNYYYPNAQPGQSAVGPAVLYLCISASSWRVLSATAPI